MSKPQILHKCEDLGYKVFDGSSDYDLNLVGVRTADNHDNAFNDFFHVCYKVNGTWHHNQFKCTTDPGLYWRANPSRIAGTAILVPGQYRGCWQLGLHQGRYEALRQCAPVKVYRDGNRDHILDFHPHTIEEGIFGINIHRSNSRRESTQVDKWSAGCQVLANPDDFAMLLELCHKQISVHPTWTKFSYTLLEE